MVTARAEVSCFTQRTTVYASQIVTLCLCLTQVMVTGRAEASAYHDDLGRNTTSLSLEAQVGRILRVNSIYDAFLEAGMTTWAATQPAYHSKLRCATHLFCSGDYRLPIPVV